MPDLQELTLKCKLTKVRVQNCCIQGCAQLLKDMPLIRTGLKRLERFCLTIYWSNNWEPIELGKLMEGIAGDSSLKYLTIQDIRDMRVEYSGGAWLPRTIGRHRSTLIELNILQFHPNAPTTSVIFGHCSRLSVLSIGMNHKLRARCFPSI